MILVEASVMIEMVIANELVARARKILVAKGRIRQTSSSMATAELVA